MNVTAKVISSFFEEDTRLNVSMLNSATNIEYDSSIDRVSGNRLYITMPTKKGYIMNVAIGSHLSISSLTDGGRLSFETRIIDIVSGSKALLIVNIPETVRHQQLRQFYRVSTYIKVGVLALSLDEYREKIKSKAEPSFISGSVNDISGGGCKIQTDLEIADGSNIVINFYDSAIDELGLVEATVIHTTKTDKKNSLSLRFTALNEPDRNKIIKYVFKRQMELRQIRQ